jgi:hypothetical protein
MTVSYKGEIDCLTKKLITPGEESEQKTIKLIIEPAIMNQILRRDGKEVFQVTSSDDENFLMTFKRTPINETTTSTQVILTDMDTKKMYLVMNSITFFDTLINEYMRTMFSMKLHYMVQFDFEEATKLDEEVLDEFDDEIDPDE